MMILPSADDVVGLDATGQAEKSGY